MQESLSWERITMENSWAIWTVARVTAVCLTTTLGLTAWDISSAAEPQVAATSQLESAAQPVVHPHINLATWYAIDPTWPQRPAHITWAAVPGVAVDKSDNVWMFTRAKPPVQVYDPAGNFVRSWGDAEVQTAHGLRLDHEGNVWVTDVVGHVVMQFTPEGKLLRTLGTRGVPGEDPTHFNKPTDVAVSPAGDVFVSDGYANNRVVRFDRDGKFVKAWGKMGVGPGEFSLPHAIVRDSKGRLYVADRNNVRIQVFNEDGQFLDQWRSLLVPWGLCITKNDEIWACGCSPMPWIGDQKFLAIPPKDQVVMQFDTSGKVLSLWTIPKGEDGKEKPGEVNWIHGIDVDSHGNLFVSDIIGKRIYKLVRQDNRPAPSR